MTASYWTHLRIGVLALSLFTVGDVAFADGAWVLWMKINKDTARTTDPLIWEVQNAMPNYHDCLTLAARENSSLFESYSIQLTDTNHATLKKGDHHLTITNAAQQITQRVDFLCLPSGMNPRH